MILAFIEADSATLWAGMKRGASVPSADSGPDRLIVWQLEKDGQKTVVCGRTQVPCTVRLRREGAFMLDAPFAHLKVQSGMVMDLQTLLDNPPPLRFNLQPAVVLSTTGKPTLFSGQETQQVERVRVVTFTTRGDPIVRVATDDERGRWLRDGVADLKAIAADGYQVQEFRPEPTDDELRKRIAPSFIDRLAEAVFIEQLRGDDEMVRTLIRSRARGSRAVAPQAVTGLLQSLEPVRATHGAKTVHAKPDIRRTSDGGKRDLTDETLKDHSPDAGDQTVIMREGWFAMLPQLPAHDEFDDDLSGGVATECRRGDRRLIYSIGRGQTDDELRESTSISQHTVPALIIEGTQDRESDGVQYRTALTAQVIDALQTLDRRTHQVVMSLFIQQSNSGGKPFTVSPNILARLQGRRSNVGGQEYRALRKQLWAASRLATIARYKPAKYAITLAKRNGLDEEDYPKEHRAVIPWFMVHKFDAKDGTPLVMSVNPLLFEQPTEYYAQNPDMRTMPVLDAMVRLDAGREAIEYSLLVAVSREFARGVRKNQQTTRRLGWLLDMVGEKGMHRVIRDEGATAARMRLDAAVNRLAGLGVRLQVIPDAKEPGDILKAHITYLDSPALLEAVNAVTDGAAADRAPAGKRRRRTRAKASK
jgi:hypothetical protein